MFWSIRYHSESGSIAKTQTVAPSRKPSMMRPLRLGSARTMAIGTLTTNSWQGGTGVKLGSGVGALSTISCMRTAVPVLCTIACCVVSDTLTPDAMKLRKPTHR